MNIVKEKGSKRGPYLFKVKCPKCGHWLKREFKPVLEVLETERRGVILCWPAGVVLCPWGCPRFYAPRQWGRFGGLARKQFSEEELQKRRERLAEARKLRWPKKRRTGRN